jgi:hypothetical protein
MPRGYDRNLDAVAQIAGRYREFVDIVEKAGSTTVTRTTA